jgi:fluoride exporter
VGLVYNLLRDRLATITPEIYTSITVGFLGSYTTFSTYALDTISLWHRSSSLSLIYWLGSAIGGVGTVKIGMTIGHWF